MQEPSPHDRASGSRRVGCLEAFGAVALLAGLATTIWVILPRMRERQNASPPSPADVPSATSGRPRRGTTGSVPAAQTPSVAAEAGVADPLLDALLHGDTDARRAACAALRKRARTDPAAWRAAAGLLLAADTPSELRQALAFVLGTIADPSPDATIADALSRFGSDTEFARAALLALGATRAPVDDDDVFGLGDQPYGVEGPGGIGITVRRQIEDESVRATIASALSRTEPLVRRAAAVALRHSLAATDARTAFEHALVAEKEDVVAQELGEALVQSARGSEDAAERDRVLQFVLRCANEPTFDGLRFRIENDLRGQALSATARSTLAELAVVAEPFAVRSFALIALAGSASTSGESAAREVRNLLTSLLSSDDDVAVRDLAARELARLPSDATTSAALARAAREDAAWNVRYTAIETLFAKDRESARPVLTAACDDPDARVARRARELLQK